MIIFLLQRNFNWIGLSQFSQIFAVAIFLLNLSDKYVNTLQLPKEE